MLSKAQSKYIRSLASQKYRDEYKVFVVEGVKLAGEWLKSDQPITLIAALPDWLRENAELIAQHPEAKIEEADEQMLQHASQLATANQVILVAAKPDNMEVNKQITQWCIGLDNLQDPGNMGTIIRIADWFGIADVICSPGCVDVYNSKVIQSAMGGHLRIRFHHSSLNEIIVKHKMPVYAATLNGINIFEITTPVPGMIIIGNESKGISPDIANNATHKITIPGNGGAESLNAGVSAGIICAILTQQK